MSAVVRRLHAEDDLSGAVHLLQRFFAEEGFTTDDETISRNTRTMSALSNCGLFVAEADGRTIGVATISLEYGIEFGWSAEMGDLYVMPEARGKGVSALLIGQIESFLRAKGAAGYQVTVTPFAEAHHGLGKFYGKLGFEGEGRLILYKKLKP